MQYQMSFQDAVKICLHKYADFKGRASRAEYWWFYVFTTLITMGLGLISESVSLLASLAFFLPSLAVAVRRLHDRGSSGWWVLLPLTIIGIIPFIIMMALPSDARTNAYGHVPCRG